MNCSICDKPLEDHIEGRETDWCIALKLELFHPTKVPGRWHWIKDDIFTGFTKDYLLATRTLYYTAGAPKPEVWDLTKLIVQGDDDWGLSYNYRSEEYYFNRNAYWGVPAPTPTLAICRAFLAEEEL
ncbi:MAG: hypothetical protein KAR06_11255 [Deltaproteobacteria bacterium]|nr:hypothetical protein [Deltaproteobacteria bacterium]